MNLKLKAFTLIELIVVMLLFGIVMAIAYNGMLMVQQLYRSYEVKKNSQMELEEFIFYFNQDFRDAKEIFSYQDELMLIRSKDTVFYRWDYLQVLRHQNGREDFYPYQLSNLSFEYHEGTERIKTFSVHLTQQLKTVGMRVARPMDAKSQFKLKE